MKKLSNTEADLKKNIAYKKSEYLNKHFHCLQKPSRRSLSNDFMLKREELSLFLCKSTDSKLQIDDLCIIVWTFYQVGENNIFSVIFDFSIL